MTSRGPFQPKTFYDSMILWRRSWKFSLSLEVEVFTQGLTSDQETSYTEHTRILGYTPAFRFENILFSSSLKQEKAEKTLVAGYQGGKKTQTNKQKNHQKENNPNTDINYKQT